MTKSDSVVPVVAFLIGAALGAVVMKAVSTSTSTSDAAAAAAFEMQRRGPVLGESMSRPECEARYRGVWFSGQCYAP